MVQNKVEDTLGRVCRHNVVRVSDTCAWRYVMIALQIRQPHHSQTANHATASNLIPCIYNKAQILPRPPLNHFCSRKLPKRNRNSVSLFLDLVSLALASLHYLSHSSLHLRLTSSQLSYSNSTPIFQSRVLQPIRSHHTFSCKPATGFAITISESVFTWGINIRPYKPLYHNAYTTSIQFRFGRCRQHPGPQPEGGWFDQRRMVRSHCFAFSKTAPLAVAHQARFNIIA